MTVVRSRPRLALALVGLVAAALLAARLIAGGGDSTPAHASTVDPHAIPHYAAGQLHRLLAATEAASTSSSQAELVSQGRALFRDTSAARTGESCESCHTNGTTNPNVGTILHVNENGHTFGRDPISLVGVGDTPPYRWIGDVPTLPQQVVSTIKTFFVNGPTQSDATTGQQAAALVAYLDQIKPATTSFDQGTMSAAALRGEVLFQGKGGCIACHGGPLFTDNKEHNTLVPNVPGWDDPGAAIPPGAFNTPTLRDIRNSAPYMHNGVFKTLRDVIDFYNTRSSIAPLGLTSSEEDDLVAYMEAL
jgi:cytochrome c peroxidase